MANKKINQLVAKTTILSTDLFPLGDGTTGQLFKKTIAELQAAIGGAVISVNGLVGTVVLDTDDIQELATPTNRYFTDARARGAISLTVTGNSGASTYSNSTGILNVPTYTLAGLGGITASFLSGASGIAYNSTNGVITYTGTVYTDASIRALLSGVNGISYNSSTGQFSYSGTVYTDSSIRALLSATAPITYNSSTGVIAINQASTSVNGFLTSTDWNTFNGKQSALTFGNFTESTSSVLTITGGTSAIIGSGLTVQVKQATTSVSGFLSSTDWNTFNGKQSALTLGNVTEVASNVLLFPDGGTNKTIGNLSIQVVQSGASTNGYLSSTDWTTFNNKQATVTLTTTGTSGAATFSAGTLNIPQYQAVLTNPVTGTGTTNFITKWTSSSAVGNSQIFDNGTNVGIGTITPSTLFTVRLPTTSLGVVMRWGNESAGDYGGLGFNSSGMFLGYAGNNHLLINSSGNVGIGTSSILSKLDLRAPNAISDSYGLMYISSTNSQAANLGGQISLGGLVNASTNTVFAAIAGRKETSTSDEYKGYLQFSTINNSVIERMRINSSGNVGIGTSSPGEQLTLSRSTYPTVKLIETTDNAQGYFQYHSDANELRLVAQSNHPLIFSTNDTERMRISSSGVFAIKGSTNPDAGGLDALSMGYTNGTGAWIQSWTGGTLSLNSEGNNVLIGTRTNNGEKLYVSGSIRATGSITANSDVRLKKNIERIENALQKVSEISGYTYNTIYDEDRHAGVIAQEIDKVLPEIVNKGNDGLMGVEYGNISALLIEAIKDLKEKNEKLEAIVEGLRK